MQMVSGVDVWGFTVFPTNPLLSYYDHERAAPSAHTQASLQVICRNNWCCWGGEIVFAASERISDRQETLSGGRQKHIKVHQRFSEYTNINSIMPAWNSACAFITQREIHESWNSPRLWADVLETVNNTETTGTDHTLTYCCFINGLIFNNCWNHNQTV